jgi:hypothetical protein
MVPSFFTYIIPVPGGKSVPQKEQFLDFGTCDLLSFIF